MSPLRRGMYALLALLSAITVFRMVRGGDDATGVEATTEGTGSSTTGGTTSSTLPTPSTAPPLVKSFERRTLGKLPGELTRAAAVPGPDGSLLVIGGLDYRRRPVGLVTQVDTKWGGTKTAGLLAQATANHAAVLINGRIMVFGGGIDGGPGLTSSQTFEGSAGKPLGDLGRGRYGAGVAVSGDRVFIVGGGDNRGDVLDVVATTDGITFTTIATLPNGVRYPAVGAVGDKIYVVGGDVGGRPLTSAFTIDIATGAIERLAEELPAATSHASAFVVGNSMFLAGGRTPQGITDRIWRVEPSVGSFVFAGYLPSPRSDSAAAVVGDRVYLAGGEGVGGLALDVWQLTPSTEEKALASQLATSGAVIDRSTGAAGAPTQTTAPAVPTPTITIRATTTVPPTTRAPATTTTSKSPTTTKPQATTTTAKPTTTTAKPPATTAKPPATTVPATTAKPPG